MIELLQGVVLSTRDSFRRRLEREEERKKLEWKHMIDRAHRVKTRQRPTLQIDCLDYLAFAERCTAYEEEVYGIICDIYRSAPHIRATDDLEQIDLELRAAGFDPTSLWERLERLERAANSQQPDSGQ